VGNLADEAFPIRTGRRTLFVWVCGPEYVYLWVNEMMDSFSWFCHSNVLIKYKGHL
jgi:hypothetical protein